MNAAPTICVGCDGKIDPPNGSLICNKCAANYFKEDPSDLTHKLWRLRKEPGDNVASVLMVLFGVACIAIIICWLCKQLL